MAATHDVLAPQSNTGHFVQFYKADEPSLNRNVASFLWDGLLRGDALVVIATQQRRESLSSHLTRLGADVAVSRREGQLAMLDAHEILSRVLINGQPDWESFQIVINDALALARPRVANANTCAYGEMVGVLWEAGEAEAAIRLEECWNKLLHRGGISLFCGYPIDVFASDFQQGHIHDVLCAHTHLMPTGSSASLGAALDRAMDDHLGVGAEQVRSLMKAASQSSGLPMPEEESAILWLRSNVPDRAENILAGARTYYEASQASDTAAELA